MLKTKKSLNKNKKQFTFHPFLLVGAQHEKKGKRVTVRLLCRIFLRSGKLLDIVSRKLGQDNS